MSDESWAHIFEVYKINQHNFDSGPFLINAEMIKKACQQFTAVGQKEVRILCKQDTREKRPKVFKDNNLFILPVKNGQYIIIRGEGYVDIPRIDNMTEIYESQLDFQLETSKAGDSEMQHLDYAYATSLIRTFVQDSTLLLTIRGRKYTPAFSFRVGRHRKLPCQVDNSKVEFLTFCCSRKSVGGRPPRAS